MRQREHTTRPYLRRHRVLAALSTGALCAVAVAAIGQVSTATGDTGSDARPEPSAAQSGSAGTVVSRPAAQRAKTPVGVSPGFMTLNLGRKQLNHDLDQLVRAGVTRLRIDLSWSVLEPAEGRFHWASTDRVLRAASARGMQVLGVVGYEPGWAVRFTSAGARLPPSPASFARFVRAAADRYAGDVSAWEIWNEPNLGPSWVSGPDPAAYADLAGPASAAIRAKDPRATILVGALAPADTADGDVSPQDFLRGIYADLPRRAFDAVSVHPYTFPRFADESQPWNTFHRMHDLYRIMAANGDAKTKLWVTEYGAPTGTAPGAVSAQTQAKMIRIGVREARRRSYVGPIYVYSQRDAGTDKAHREDNFGLLTHAGKPKPAWRTLVEVARP